MAMNTRVQPLTDDERARLMRLVRNRGEHRAAVAVGVARNTVARALARLHLQAGSVLLIRTGLASLAEKPGQPIRPTPPQAA